MAQTAGFQGLCKIATTASPTTTIGQLKDAQKQISADMYDVTFMGDRAKDFLSGLYGGTMTLKLNYDKTDSVQAVVEAAIFAGTLLYFSFSPTNGAANTNYAFTAYVKDYNVGDPVNNVVESTVGIQITGAVTVS